MDPYNNTSSRYVSHLPYSSSDHHHHHRRRDSHRSPPPLPPPLYPPLPPAPPPPPPSSSYQSNFTFLRRSPPRVSNRTLIRSPDSTRPDTYISGYDSSDFERNNSRVSYRDNGEFMYRNTNSNNNQRVYFDRIGDGNDYGFRYTIGSDSRSSGFKREVYEFGYVGKERFLSDRDANRSWGSVEIERNAEFARREQEIYGPGARFSDDRDWERGREERADFFGTPTKREVQKKSVLLRIGRPNEFRSSRSYEERLGSFRGKEKERDNVYPSYRLVERREGNPVDLDISFKSNALVAKASVTAHSSPAQSLTPTDRKVRRVITSDLPQRKFSESSVKSGKSGDELDFPSTSEKGTRRVESVIVSGHVSMANDSGGSSSVKVSPTCMVSDERGKRSSSGEAQSGKIRKKMKVGSLSSPALNLKSLKEDIESVTVDNNSLKRFPASDQGLMHLKEKTTCAVLGFEVDDTVSLPSGNLLTTKVEDESAATKEKKACAVPVFELDATVSLPNVLTTKEYESPAAINLEVENSKVDSGRSLLLDFDQSSSTHLLDSLSPMEAKIDKSTETVCGSVCTFISGSDIGQTELQNGRIISGGCGIQNVRKQFCQNATSILPENGIEGSLEGTISEIGRNNASLSSLHDNKIHEEGQVHLNLAIQDPHKTSDSEFGLEKHENITVRNIDLINASPRCSVNQATNFLDNHNEKASPNTHDNCEGGHGNLDLLKPGEAETHEVAVIAYSSYCAPIIPSISNTDFTDHQGNDIGPRTCTLDDNSNQTGPDRASVIPEITLIEKCSRAEVLTREGAEVHSGNEYPLKVKRKRNFEDIQLDLSSPKKCDTPLDLFSYELDENTKSSSSPEVLVATELKDDGGGTENLLDTSHSCEDRDSSLHGSQTIEASFADGPTVKDNIINGLNSASSLYNKKRKVVASDEMIESEGGSLSDKNTFLSHHYSKMKSDEPLCSAITVQIKSASSPSQDTQKSSQSLSTVKTDSNLTTKHPVSSVPRVTTGPASFNLNSAKKETLTNSNSKSRTWHRTDKPIASMLLKKTILNPVQLQRQSPKKVGKVQGSSYIRKGNSLVRKPATVPSLPHLSHASSSSTSQLNPSARDCISKSSASENKVGTCGSASWSGTRVRDEIRKSSVSVSTVGIDNSAACLKLGGLAAPSEIPKAPPVAHISKSLDSTNTLVGDFTPSVLANTQSDGNSETTSVSLGLMTDVDISKISEDSLKSPGTVEFSLGLINDLGSQRVLDDGNSLKKITYVKRKSNQLIAASNANGMFGQDWNKAATSVSDSYYKRRRNQLIRASPESHTMPRVVLPESNLSSEAHKISGIIAKRNVNKRHLGKAIIKTRKPSKFSLVWRLSTQSPKKDAVVLQHQKGLQNLFPWKRATHWQNSTHGSAYSNNNNSLSVISQKLLLTRKRDTIYTRSKRGFSLRISKLLSVGGSSLKWSKSIEKNSKRANEEATLAVAAVQKKKREQTKAPCALSGTKNRNHFSRERIFRIGSVRYKMDPTRRTLQRISDDKEVLCSSTLESEKNVRKSYIPRRLLIGNEEYVRIGNGNQLIRDPKKRTRTFASEKVRWSLHTARLRLARKSTYCQFFTRFGKCNKDDGKCPYIHDPAKIAVCTKFLSGSCSNLNCVLTHKVIPERMQDCSYYLQGLCSNKNCPYRHVNVNAKASICEGFLRGYCADGNECRKKHTYVCPTYEATGTCPQGSHCKLHHPKKRSKGTKSKSTRNQRNAQGRYFGSRILDTMESGTVMSERLNVRKGEEIFCQEGKFSDYINIEFSNEEAVETILPSSREELTMWDSIPANGEATDYDEQLKPISIMYKVPATQCSAAVDDVDQRTGSDISESWRSCKVRL